MIGSDNAPIKRDGSDRQLIRIVNDMLAEAKVGCRFLLKELDNGCNQIELIKEPPND